MMNLLKFTACCVLVATPTLAGAQQTLSGDYTFDLAAGDDISKAIREATKSMNFLTRPIARSRLKSATKVYPKLHLEITADSVRSLFYAGHPLATPNDGSPVRWKREDGEVVSASGTVNGETLSQTFIADDGKRVNVTTPLPDGSGLQMQVTITSPRLPAPLTYRLVYKRD